MAVAFIVDGVTEKKIVQELCPGAVVRMTNLNGKNVSVAAMAKAVHSFLNLFKGRHFPVIIVADREGREMTSQQLEESLSAEICSLYDKVDIIVASPDRMIENWMLSDVALFKSKYNIDIPKCFEGANGKGELRRLLREKDVVYHELTLGHKMFCEIDVIAASKTSESLARFRDKAKQYCKWLRH